MTKAQEALKEMRKLNEVSSWQQKAKEEMEKEFELELSIENTSKDSMMIVSDGGSAPNGESEWDVFKNDKAAEQAALDHVRDMLNEEPETFTQDWLKDYYYISDTDKRLIAGEEGDNYAGDIRSEGDGERVADEAGMKRQFEKIRDLRDEETNPAKLKRIEKMMDKLLDKAKDKVSSNYAKDLEKRLKKDPFEWLEELGYTPDNYKDLKFLVLNVDDAAQGAIDTDGVAHFLDRYDGNPVELKSGAVAMGTN